MSSLSRFVILLAVSVTALAATALPASAATVVNGDFETGTLAGWTAVNNGTGQWRTYTASTPPSGSGAPAPPQGIFAATTEQGGPGSHILYQNVVLPAGQTHRLTLTLYYENRAGRFVTPDSLSHTSGANQQYRVDIMKPTAPVNSVAAADVLTRVFRTEVGTPAIRAPFTVTADLSAFAGQTVRLRLAEVDNQSFFNAHADAVSIRSEVTDSDGDGIVDTSDNCPTDANADQANNDGDNQGDVCDPDDDNDTVNDGDDNCPLAANPDQMDRDFDGRGDACDPQEPNTAGCKVNAGARITTAAGNKATLGGESKTVSSSTAKGEHEYTDHGPAAPFKFTSSDIDGVTCSSDGTRATILGDGKVTKTESVFFRIDVVDSGEPGGSDTYRIRLSNGYDSGERTLDGGNVQIHR